MFSLLDDYKASGHDLDSFRKEAEAMDAATQMEKVNFADLQICSFFKKFSNKIVCQVMEPEMLTFNDGGTYLMNRTVSIGFSGLPEKSLLVLDEFCDTSKTLFRFPSSRKGYYFLGDTIYKTMAARQTGIGGGFLRKAGYVRNMALAESFGLNPGNMDIVVRTDGRIKKIFAMYKGVFKRYDFSSLMPLIESLKDIRYVSWKMSHEGAAVYLEFDRMWETGYYPGIILCLSDTGYVSASVLYTCRHKNHPEEMYQILRKHDIHMYLDNPDKMPFADRVSATESALSEKVDSLLKKQMDASEICKKAELTTLVGYKKRNFIEKYLRGKEHENMSQLLEELLDVRDKEFSTYQTEQFRLVLGNLLSDIRLY